jgi:hypothetical protein
MHFNRSSPPLPQIKTSFQVTVRIFMAEWVADSRYLNTVWQLYQWYIFKWCRKVISWLFGKNLASLHISKHCLFICLMKLKNNTKFSVRITINPGDRGSTVVNVLRYKSKGRWFYPRWCHGIFHWHKSFWSHYGPGVDSAPNRNEYQQYFLGVNATGT